MGAGEAEREARRRARAAWPVHVHPLGREPPDDLAHLSPDERVTLLRDLSVHAWLLAGNPMPALPRRQWPGTVIRGA